jgi:tRNA threonylcarbamoyladenosine modification (KEOPS) complex  Pcc1 subunit
MLAEIMIEFKSYEDATHIMEAINPDNSPLPPGITIQTQVEDTQLIIRIQCERGIDSLRATVEDIMSAIDLSARTISTIE